MQIQYTQVFSFILARFLFYLYHIQKLKPLTYTDIALELIDE